MKPATNVNTEAVRAWRWVKIGSVVLTPVRATQCNAPGHQGHHWITIERSGVRPWVEGAGYPEEPLDGAPCLCGEERFLRYREPDRLWRSA